MDLRRRLLLALVAWLAVLVPSPGRADVRLAIPPFENLTGEPRMEWIGEGFARSLAEKLNRVAQVSATALRARGLVSPSREIDAARLVAEAAPTAANAVLVGAVVKGADVDRLDEPLEITMRVVDLRTTRQSGALELTGRMRDLFAMEAQLAEKTAGLFGVALSPAETEALRTQETRSLQAYRETVLGTMYLEDGNCEAATAMLEQALTHHPGIFYPKAHTLLAEAYLRSGKKEEMLRRMRQDAASLAGTYYQFAAAQESDGQPEEAARNYGLFVKYTDRRTLYWRRTLPPALEVRGADDRRIWLSDRSRELRFMVLPLDGSGAATEAAAVDTVPPAAAPGSATLVPEDERRRLATPVLACDGRLYYGLDNGFILGRDARSGARVWAYRLSGIPAGTLLVAAGTLLAQDDRGNLYRLGLAEGGEPTDVSAYLRLADLARRREQAADAEAIYRHIVEEVKPNVPEAWHGLWELARAAGNQPAADEAWRRYEESLF